MTIIAVKQRIDDPYTFDIVYRGSDDKFYIFENTNLHLMKELGSGKHQIIGIPCDCSVKEFVKELNNVHFQLPGIKGQIRFEGTPQEKIYPICEN